MQDVNEIGRLFSDRRLRAPTNHHHHQPLNCPRCNSLNTKFCYYNNYNLSQPRYFCKNCRRYWTKGGVLRNVPVGGGCRKSKRSSKRKLASKSSSGNAAKPIEQPPIHPSFDPFSGGPDLTGVGVFGNNELHQNLLRFGETETTPFEHLSSGTKLGNEVLAVPDWNEAHCGGGGGDGGMFDLTHGSEWSESMQWNESDDHLYLPP